MDKPLGPCSCPSQIVPGLQEKQKKEHLKSPTSIWGKMLLLLCAENSPGKQAARAHPCSALQPRITEAQKQFKGIEAYYFP